MNFNYDDKGNKVTASLDPGEQHYLVKENLRLAKEYKNETAFTRQ